MTQKPEGIRQDGIWDAVEFWLLIVLAVIAGGAVFVFAPVGAYLGILLTGTVAIIVWLLGYYLIRVPYTFLLVGGIFMLMILWSWSQTRPTLDTLFYDDLIGTGDSLTVSATGTERELIWTQPYVYATPTKHVRDWTNRDACTEERWYACAVAWTLTLAIPEGNVNLHQDGTLDWPTTVTDEIAAKFICDAPAESHEDYNRLLPYMIAIRLARPSLSPILQAECGL